MPLAAKGSFGTGQHQGLVTGTTGVSVLLAGHFKLSIRSHQTRRATPEDLNAYVGYQIQERHGVGGVILKSLSAEG
jgi:hypothetical protein